MVAVWVVAVLLGIALLWLLVAKVVARVWPFPMPHQVSFILEIWSRRFLLPAGRTAERMGVKPGMLAVEVGPGTGYHTFEVARRLKPEGRLVCVDIQPEMAERVRSKAARLGADNVEVRVADAKDLRLDTGRADLVFYIAVLGEVPDQEAAVAEARRVLKPGGVLSISELVLDPHYRTRAEVRNLALGAGFEPVSVAGNFFFYTANFRKPVGS